MEQNGNIHGNKLFPSNPGKDYGNIKSAEYSRGSNKPAVKRQSFSVQMRRVSLTARTKRSAKWLKKTPH